MPVCLVVKMGMGGTGTVRSAAAAQLRGTHCLRMQRIAAPMVGGLGTSFVLELLVSPAMYAVWRTRRPLASGAPAGYEHASDGAT